MGSKVGEGVGVVEGLGEVEEEAPGEMLGVGVGVCEGGGQVRTRTVLALVSEIKYWPGVEGDTATPLGALNPAAAAHPSTLPPNPEPARVVVAPVPMSMLRRRWLPVSVRIRRENTGS